MPSIVPVLLYIWNRHNPYFNRWFSAILYLAIEVKTTTKDKIYIEFPQIDALCEFSEKFGAKPYIGVKFKYTKWLFLEPEKTPRTKSDNYKIEKDFALEKALEIDEITGIDRQMKF